MNTTSTYIINAILVLLVVRQIREHRLDLRGLAVPVLAVGAAAVFFLRSVPGRGNDIPLELICASAGAVMGALAGLATHLRRSGDGPVQRRPPDHRRGRVGRGPGDDGAGRRAYPPGRAVRAGPPAGRSACCRPRAGPRWYPCLTWLRRPPRARL